MLKVSGVLIGVSLALRAISVCAQPVLYDNFGTDLRIFLDETTAESGDQITLAPNTPRVINNFTFEYFLKPSTASGSETVRIRMYKNDGPAISAQDSTPTPSTVLYDSGSLSLNQVGQQRMTLSDLNLTVPDSFTWTAQFSGGNVAQGKVAGVELYSPPTVGANNFQFWQKNNGAWDVYFFDQFPTDFGARIDAVPEPGTVTLLGLGAGGLGVLSWSRRTKRQ
jgi:hypothetical protein